MSFLCLLSCHQIARPMSQPFSFQITFSSRRFQLIHSQCSFSVSYTFKSDVTDTKKQRCFDVHAQWELLLFCNVKRQISWRKQKWERFKSFRLHAYSFFLQSSSVMSLQMQQITWQITGKQVEGTDSLRLAIPECSQHHYCLLQGYLKFLQAVEQFHWSQSDTETFAKGKVECCLLFWLRRCKTS